MHAFIHTYIQTYIHTYMDTDILEHGVFSYPQLSIICTLVVYALTEHPCMYDTLQPGSQLSQYGLLNQAHSYAVTFLTL